MDNLNCVYWYKPKEKNVETKEERARRWLGMEKWRLPNEEVARITHKKWVDSIKLVALAHQTENVMRASYIRALELLNHPDEAYPKRRIKLTPEERIYRRIESVRRWQSNPENQEKIREWRNSPEVKKRKSEYDKQRRQKQKEKQ